MPNLVTLGKADTASVLIMVMTVEILQQISVSATLTVALALLYGVTEVQPKTVLSLHL